MDASLQSLIGRLEHLSDQFIELREGVQRAVDIADLDPEMALTRARKVLEFVIRDVYERRIDEPPGTRPLENLLQRLVKDGCFPDRLDAYATAIRKLGNVGTHSFGEKVAVADVYQSLAQLMPILEWYVEVERPEPSDGRAARSQAVQVAEKRVTRPPAAVHEITIVPKGLRSFDANDAKFFLDLLPGARDEHGLPESIRFWKHRIEFQVDVAFTVGVIYGPSGCGKSSFVKAGLLPRLTPNVLTLHVEATANDTEARLLNGLRKRCPWLPADLGIVETLTELRRGHSTAGGQKVLFVLDQFEQWLHARRGEENSALAQALRQCDGEHVQCIVLVRDDFWLALSRLMSDLHIELLQGQNTALVDLFDLLHARNVLTAFGQAFGRLQQVTTKEQDDFLAQAIEGLADDGRVICVRLALFAEMVKGRPWTVATLRAVGGTYGVGVSFLEETFCSGVNQKNCLHQVAARAVLNALLPEQGSDIKGNMRSQDELYEVSGYVRRPKDFDELLRILDGELRLITPAEPPERESHEASQARYYQLTHDYLVHSLREWLTTKQKEKRRGRAELRLAERAGLWNAKRENRRLPSMWEYLNIRIFTDQKHWTEPQRRMMKKAGQVYGVRSGAVFALLVVILLGGLAAFRQIEGRRQADYAAALVEQLVKADIAQVAGVVEKLDDYRLWVDPLLKQEEDHAEQGSRHKLHLALALLPVDAGQVAYLRDQLLLVTPNEFPTVRDALLPHKDVIIDPLWNVALDRTLSLERRFQAASALATYTPEDQRWEEISTLVAGHLVSRQASEFLAWREALRPVSQQLLRPLGLIYRDKHRKEQPRIYAAETLADYSSNDLMNLFDLLADAEQFQFQVVFDKLTEKKEQTFPLARQELKKQAANHATEDDKEVLAKRQANVAVALYRMGASAEVWPMLKFSPDPRVRSYIIHWLSELEGDPQAIIDRLDTEPDVTVRRALLLTLGDFSDMQLPESQRLPLVERLLARMALPVGA